jgi:RsiW-degrading membrane proteinase PrsW (M82 family)
MTESSSAGGVPFDPQAVLAGRPPGRTPVAYIVGVTITTACAIVVLGVDVAQSFAVGAGAAPFAIALPLALLPVPLLIALVLWMDRLEPEPYSALAFAFGWGAGIAALAALIVNTANLEYVTMPALGATTGEYVAATFGAPIVEETLKGLVIIGLLWRRRAELDGPTDGVIYATMVGLGFAMIENVGYYINALVSPERGGIELLGYTFVLRGLLSPLLHPIFTSMTGLGVAYAASRRRGGYWAVALGLLAAMVLHGTWNGLSLFGAAGLAAGYLIMGAVLVGLIGVLVTEEDIAMLSSLRARSTARRWARAVGGHPASAAMSDFQLAATELALARAKADRGVLDFNAFAEREHSLLGLMAVARHAFTSRVPGGSELTPAPWATSGSVFTHGVRPWLPGKPRPEADAGCRHLLGGVGVRRRQVAYLLPGDAEPDAVVERGHSAERDGDFPAAKQVPFADQHVSHPAADRVDAEPANLPDVAVGGVHPPATVLLHLARRDDIDGLPFRDPGNRAALRDRPAGAAPPRRQQLNRGLIGKRELGQGLLRGLKVPELRLGAAERSPVPRHRGQVKRHQPGQPTPAHRLDHQMSNGAVGGLEYHGLHLATVPVAADSLAAEDKRYHHSSALPRPGRVHPAPGTRARPITAGRDRDRGATTFTPPRGPDRGTVEFPP